MIDYKTAVQQVADAGIPIRNVYVNMGDVYDYQGHPDVPESVRVPVGPGPAWVEGNDEALAWLAWEHPEIATRRWAFVETSAGLAVDDDGRIADYLSRTPPLEAAGWVYQDSGGFRIEVDPSTCPARPA